MSAEGAATADASVNAVEHGSSENGPVEDMSDIAEGPISLARLAQQQQSNEIRLRTPTIVVRARRFRSKRYCPSPERGEHTHVAPAASRAARVARPICAPAEAGLDEDSETGDEPALNWYGALVTVTTTGLGTWKLLATLLGESDMGVTVSDWTLSVLLALAFFWLERLGRTVPSLRWMRQRNAAVDVVTGFCAVCYGTRLTLKLLRGFDVQAVHRGQVREHDSERTLGTMET